MKVKQNEELFIRMKAITGQMTLILPTIVEKDKEMTEDQIDDYFELWENLEVELDRLYDLMNDWVYQNKPKGVLQEKE